MSLINVNFKYNYFLKSIQPFKPIIIIASTVVGQGSAGMVSRSFYALVSTMPGFSASYPTPSSRSPVHGSSAAAQLGNVIQLHLKSCIPHVVRYPSDVPLNYEMLSAPVSQQHLSLADGVRKRPYRALFNVRRYHMDAIRNFCCFLILFSTSADIMYSRMASTYYKNMPLKQGWVLSFRTALKARMMPYYLVAFMSVTDGRQDAFTAIQALWLKLQESLDKYHPTPSFFLAHHQQGPKHNVGGPTNCFYYCWFCHYTSKWWEFGCRGNEKALPAVMMDTQRRAFGGRKNIPWLFSDTTREAVPKKLSTSCPFSLNATATCLMDHTDRVLEFLIHDSNWTQVQDSLTFKETGFVNLKTPTIEYKPFDRMLYPVDVLLTGPLTSSFRFIAADNVRKKGTSSLVSTLSAPYSANVWLGIAVSALALAFCMAPFAEQSLGSSVLANLLGFLSSLVDQFTVLAKRIHGVHLRMANIATIFWLLPVIVITNSYKAIMKSNYVLEPTYTMPWKSLRQLRDFSFVFPFTARNTKEMEGVLAQFLKQISQRCNMNVSGDDWYKSECVRQEEGRQWSGQCWSDTIRRGDLSGCQFFREENSNRDKVKKALPNEKAWWKKQLQYTENIKSRGRIRPIQMLEQVIRNELVEPRTAFVTPSEQFPNDWAVFQAVMKNMYSGVKFVGSGKAETVGLNAAWFIRSGYDEDNFGNFMWLRAAALMESGIYAVWKKWDDMRRLFNGPQVVEEGFLALSFDNSDIHLPFYLYAVCFLVALLALLGELVACSFERRKVQNMRTFVLATKA